MKLGMSPSRRQIAETLLAVVTVSGIVAVLRLVRPPSDVPEEFFRVDVLICFLTVWVFVGKMSWTDHGAHLAYQIPCATGVAAIFPVIMGLHLLSVSLCGITILAFVAYRRFRTRAQGRHPVT